MNLRDRFINQNKIFLLQLLLLYHLSHLLSQVVKAVVPCLAMDQRCDFWPCMHTNVRLTLSTLSHGRFSSLASFSLTRRIRSEKISTVLTWRRRRFSWPSSPSKGSSDNQSLQQDHENTKE